MPDLKALEDEVEKTTAIILAAEKWAKSYRKSPTSHAKLIKLQAKLDRVMRKYFKTLANERVFKHINWAAYHTELIKAAEKPKYTIKIIFDDESFTNEEGDLLVGLVHDPLLDGMGIGIDAGQDIYHDIGMTQSTSSVLQAAREASSKLVTGVTNTTVDRIQQSITSSLHLGESNQEAAARLSDLIDDPRRALMIARTESVNSYNTGLLSYGREAGAKTKVWQAYNPIDEECDIDGEEVNIDDEYSNGLDGPTAHPNCQCGQQLTFDTGDEASADQTDE